MDNKQHPFYIIREVYIYLYAGYRIRQLMAGGGEARRGEARSLFSLCFLCVHFFITTTWAHSLMS